MSDSRIVSLDDVKDGGAEWRRQDEAAEKSDTAHKSATLAAWLHRHVVRNVWIKTSSGFRMQEFRRVRWRQVKSRWRQVETTVGEVVSVINVGRPQMKLEVMWPNGTIEEVYHQDVQRVPARSIKPATAREERASKRKHDHLSPEKESSAAEPSQKRPALMSHVAILVDQTSATFT